MLTNVRQENPAKGIFPIAVAQRMRPDNLVSFLPVLFQKHHVAPRGGTKVTGVVVGIPRPGESVVGHMIPLFACDFACFAPDANTGIGEESNLDVIFHEGMPALIGALNSFADHNAFLCSGRLVLVTSGECSLGAPGGGCSGCRFGGPPRGTYRSSQSSKAGPRGNRPGTILQASALVSMIVTFGSPEMGIRSLAAPPRTFPAVPK